MEKRGQSALEYLMTYGWALIVIAIVIGVLIYVTSTSTGGIVCQSQSTQIVLKEWSVATGTDNVGVTIQNATGGAITISSVASGGDFADDTNSGPFPSIAKNATYPLTGISGPDASGSINNGTVTVSYTTEGQLPATATIVCAGTV